MCLGVDVTPASEMEFNERGERAENCRQEIDSRNHLYPESTYECLQTAVEFLEIISKVCVCDVCGEGVLAALLSTPVC